MRSSREPEAIVLSPGPCTPNEAGICLDLIAAANGAVPIFGVCLGHQAIGQAYGGKVVRAPKLMHGKLSTIVHEGDGVFHGINGPFQATRYHSLTIAPETMPESLKATAHADDGVIMGAAAPERSGARRAVPSRKHRLRARPPHPREFPRDRARLQRARWAGRRPEPWPT